MFIAHLPAGYLATRALCRRVFPATGSAVNLPRPVLLCGLVGAIFPDFDLAWWYLVDHQQTFHREYWTHFPLIWAVPAMLSWLWLRTGTHRLAAATALAFFLGGVLHLLLDTVTGDVLWLAPMSREGWSLASIEARFDPWWLNLIVHWSPLVEGLLVAWGWHRAAQDSLALHCNAYTRGHSDETTVRQ